MKKQKGDLVHLRFEYMDALNSVRDFLYAQKSAMIITRMIKNYNFLNKEQEKIQDSLRNKFREAEKTFQKLQKIMPKLKTRKVQKIHEERRITEIGDDGNIESQLQDIQKKLNYLSRQ